MIHHNKYQYLDQQNKLEERYQIFYNHYNFETKSKKENEKLKEFFITLIRVRYFIGEPIIGASSGIHCKPINSYANDC